MPGATQRHCQKRTAQNQETLISKLALLVAAMFTLATSAAIGGQLHSFPGGLVDASTMRTQQKVEELFDSGEYKRALFIYKNELAPVGDKYAQYMVGYIYLTGAGVPEDPSLAAAWYRLAAERDNPNFVAVRDQLMRSLSDIDRGRSDVQYLDLMRRYSDAVILLDAIRSDLVHMTPRTGSRLGGGATPVSIIDPRSGASMSAEELDRRLSRRVQSRLDYLGNLMDVADFDLDAERLDIDALEELVNDYVESAVSR